MEGLDEPTYMSVSRTVMIWDKGKISRVFFTASRLYYVEKIN